MGKTYKGKTCVYCGLEGVSQSGDHVFAREFFPKDQRANLPQVPACDACNGTKSTLEHYLLTVLPFGGQHAASTGLLTTQTPRRLARNKKLHGALSAGARNTWVKERGLYRQTFMIPFDSSKMEALFAMIARGLVAHHWRTQIPQEYFVGASVLSATGESFFEPFLRGGGQNRASASLGDGLVQYEGVQALHDPFLTIWRFRLYGGVMLGGDPRAPGVASPHLWAMSVREQPREIFGDRGQ